MQISLKKIVLHMYNVYWFDRKTYTFVYSDVPPENDECYRRYIPLVQLDQEDLTDQFMDELNDKVILRKWKNFEFCFEEFCQREHLSSRWFDYYKNAKKQAAIQWCKEHKIKYRGEEDFEDK